MLMSIYRHTQKEDGGWGGGSGGGIHNKILNYPLAISKHFEHNVSWNKSSSGFIKHQPCLYSRHVTTSWYRQVWPTIKEIIHCLRNKWRKRHMCACLFFFLFRPLLLLMTLRIFSSPGSWGGVGERERRRRRWWTVWTWPATFCTSNL